VVNLTETDITVDLDDVYINKLTITNATRTNITFGGKSEIDELSVSGANRLNIIAKDKTTMETAKISGGTNVSLTLQDDAEAKKAVISAKGTKITVQGDTARINKTQLLASATLMDSTSNAKTLRPFGIVSVETADQVYLYANIENVYVSVTASISVGKVNIIDSLTVESTAKNSVVSGYGTIQMLIAEANCILAINVTEKEVANNVTATITDPAENASSAIVGAVNASADGTTVTVNANIINYISGTATVTLTSSDTKIVKEKVTVNKDGSITNCTFTNVAGGTYTATVEFGDVTNSSSVTVEKTFEASGVVKDTTKIYVYMNKISDATFTVDNAIISSTKVKYVTDHYEITTNEMEEGDHEVIISASGYKTFKLIPTWSVVEIPLKEISLYYDKDKITDAGNVTGIVSATVKNITSEDSISITVTPYKNDSSGNATTTLDTSNKKTATNISREGNTISGFVELQEGKSYIVEITVRNTTVNTKNLQPFIVETDKKSFNVNYAIALDNNHIKVKMSEPEGGITPTFTLKSTDGTSSETAIVSQYTSVTNEIGYYILTFNGGISSEQTKTLQISYKRYNSYEYTIKRNSFKVTSFQMSTKKDETDSSIDTVVYFTIYTNSDVITNPINSVISNLNKSDYVKYLMNSVTTIKTELILQEEDQNNPGTYINKKTYSLETDNKEQNNSVGYLMDYGDTGEIVKGRYKAKVTLILNGGYTMTLDEIIYDYN
jgi:hypothetical protein